MTIETELFVELLCFCRIIVELLSYRWLYFEIIQSNYGSEEEEADETVVLVSFKR